MNLQAIDNGTAMSWVLSTLFAIFFLTCMRVKGNFKYATALMRDMFGVRERENMFDVTVRESSFILLAMLLTASSIGLVLYNGVQLYGDRLPAYAIIPGISLGVGGELIPIAVCMGIAIVYLAIMWCVYYTVGHIFSDEVRTRMWLRGYTSSMAIGSLFFFPLALVEAAYPVYASEITLIGLLLLILVKILFIVKGFRIFFTESSSWVVFLYYLCSLEIIPLSITFGVACSLLD